MELQPLEDYAVLRRDIVLLLKCAKSVNWVIKVRGLVGKLDVVVSIRGGGSSILIVIIVCLPFFFDFYNRWLNTL